MVCDRVRKSFCASFQACRRLRECGRQEWWGKLRRSKFSLHDISSKECVAAWQWAFPRTGCASRCTGAKVVSSHLFQIISKIYPSHMRRIQTDPANFQSSGALFFSRRYVDFSQSMGGPALMNLRNEKRHKEKLAGSGWILRMSHLRDSHRVGATTCAGLKPWRSF